MDMFEKAVAESINKLWTLIDEGVNTSAAQALVGRAGSSVAEDIILEVMEALDSDIIAALKDEVDNVLIADENPYRFHGFQFRPKDGNAEAHARSIEDVIVLLEREGEVIPAYVNIKVSNGKSGQADNSCSWKAAAYALYGTLDVTRRDAFLQLSGDFTNEEHHNYFFWVLFKNDDATVLTHGHVNSILSIDPDAGLRFNINQAFPVQVVHSTKVSHVSADHAEIPLRHRRKIFHSWLTVRMAGKYSDLSTNVIDSLANSPSPENLSEYLALMQSQMDQVKKLNDLIAEAKRLKVESELVSTGLTFDKVTVEEENIVAYLDGATVVTVSLAEVA